MRSLPLRTVSTLGAVVTLTLASAAIASADDCAGPAGCTQEARSAGAFTDSVGVNTHLGYDDQPYGTAWPMVRDRLVELGVKHVRDASYRDGTRLGDVVPHMQELGRLGIRGNLLAGDPGMRYGAGTIDQHLAWVKKNVLSFTESLEGPNEYDNPTNDPNWQQTLRSYQCEWARQIRTDPSLSAKTVIGPSPGGVGFSTLGDLTSCLDAGNLHPYPGAWSPDRSNVGDLSVQLAGAQKVSGSKPVWITESGYHNAVACVCGHAPVSETASGVYMPRMFMENFRRGVPRTYAYELIDGRPDPLRTDPQANFGLLRHDGTAKPAFTALRNVMGILGDSGTASGSLSYSLKCTADCSAPLRHVLMRKSTGEYYLAVWPESSVWNAQTRTDASPSAPTIEFTVSSPVRRLDVFDPSRSQAPLSSSTETSYRGKMSNGLLILGLTPSDPVPAPAPAPPAVTPVPEPAPTPPAVTPVPEPDPVPAPAPTPPAVTPVPESDPGSAPAPTPAPEPKTRQRAKKRALSWTAASAVRQLESTSLRTLRGRTALRVSARAMGAGSYRIRLGRGIVVAEGAHTFRRGGTQPVALRLRPRGIRLLRRAARSSLVLRVEFVDGAGRQSVSRRVRIAR
ncbi:MAG: hypothetical protein AVDCRST_MAG53-2298 [uncultured Solirubrobacteraceae bacterium]|uniref:Uncharacterized protein n=1 Tax=uncultured Solirubrobacteraceae bacterium TaxID=1162706 RepID=A0A6J4STS6_9ACTN|nr:MAG: hypothetical protein AVDCRST_MAG53-2298 [uncultured Solirubrobacteraceae bacterium]